MINSKQKEKRGEREFANFLKTHGIQARRGVQYQGSPDSPDVVSELKNLHFEVKRTEKLNIYTAFMQAKEDSGKKIPIVAHKKNHKNWLVIMDAEDWLKFSNFIKENESE